MTTKTSKRLPLYHKRGALSNPQNRFAPYSYHATEEQDNTIKTEVYTEKASSILNRQTSPDIPFALSLNPYRGCEHGCVYCYARPTHQYLGLSSGIDFESKIFAKTNAAELLLRSLEKKTYRCTPIALGSNTDPYQPVEKDLHITRSILTILLRCRHPVCLTTKSSLILRDIDLLTALAEHQLVRVFISLTSCDAVLARQLEPRAPTPDKRLATIKTLAAHGIPTTLMLAPLIPALNDMAIESILQAGAQAGAQQAYYVLLRLPYDVKELWQEWLATYYPQRQAKITALLRSSRNGKDNDSQFHSRMRGQGVYAQMLAQRFHIAKKRYRLDQEPPPLNCDLFERPNSSARLNF